MVEYYRGPNREHGADSAPKSQGLLPPVDADTARTLLDFAQRLQDLGTAARAQNAVQKVDRFLAVLVGEVDRRIAQAKCPPKSVDGVGVSASSLSYNDITNISGPAALKNELIISAMSRAGAYPAGSASTLETQQIPDFRDFFLSHCAIIAPLYLKMGLGIARTFLQSGESGPLNLFKAFSLK